MAPQTINLMESHTQFHPLTPVTAICDRQGRKSFTGSCDATNTKEVHSRLSPGTGITKKSIFIWLYNTAFDLLSANHKPAIQKPGLDIVPD